MTSLTRKYLRMVATGLLAGAMAVVTGSNLAGRAPGSNSGKIVFEGDRFEPWGLSGGIL